MFVLRIRKQRVDMRLFFIIGAGGFIGSVLRYLTAHWAQSRFLSAFPFGTLAVNVIGCLAIGLVFGLQPAWRAANIDPIEALRS